MSMISVLALASCEKLINHILSTDAITQEQLGALDGKVLRVCIAQPEISVDVLFCERHVRFEPVHAPIFEHDGSTAADCSLHVDSLAHLLSLLQNPAGNLPIRGDHRILMQVKSLLENFEPDLWQKLEAIVGYNISSHLYVFGQELTPLLNPLKQLIKDAGNQLINATDPKKPDALDEAILAKKQQLLQLQSDIERQQARLAAIESQLNTIENKPKHKPE